jgi:hypothetical protein
MIRRVARARHSPLAGAGPLAPRSKWRAILLATLLLAPGYWSLLTGLVAEGSDARNAPLAAPYIAFGLALLPFVFMVLAFLSEHPRAASATAKALVLAVLVGGPVSGFAGDVVTGFVAGVGAGGIVAIRADPIHSWRMRALAVAVVSAYAFILVRTLTPAGLLLAPVLPFTAVGVADHLSERRRDRAAS